VGRVGSKPDSNDTTFLQCFDTVCWVIIWPVKYRLRMTYIVFSGTLNPTIPYLENMTGSCCEDQCLITRPRQDSLRQGPDS